MQSYPSKSKQSSTSPSKGYGGPTKHEKPGLGRGFHIKPKETKQIQGTSYQLETNHFALKILNPDLQVSIYAIEVMPKLSETERGFIVAQLLETQATQLEENFGKLYMPTASMTLYSLKKITKDVELETKLGDTRYFITLKYADSFTLSSERNEVNMYVNSCIKQILKGKMGLAGMGKSQKLFDIGSTKTVSNISIMNGFHTSAKNVESGLMLMIEPIHKIRYAQSMLDHLDYLRTYKKLPYTNKALCPEFAGLSVTACYGTYRTYRLVGIDLSKNPQSYTIQDLQINLVDYFKANYNITIKHPKQPLLVAQVSRKIEEVVYLVPELCTRAFIAQKDLKNRKLMQDVARLRCSTPYKQKEKYKELISEIANNPKIQAAMKQCGLHVNMEPVFVEGEVMQDVKLVDGKPADRHSMTNGKKRLVLGKQEWVFVYSGHSFQQADRIYNEMIKQGRLCGIELQEPEWLELFNGRTETFQKQLRERVNPRKHRLVFLLLERDNQYPQLKQICTNEKGVVSQFCLKTTVYRKAQLPQISQKILNQIYAKLGKDLYELRLPSELKKGETMVVGYDVSHKGETSMVGFCASVNAKMTQYFSDYWETKENLEVVESIHLRFQEAIKQFTKNNKQAPKRIIVFRDGVGESYFDTIYEGEIRKMLSAIGSIKVCFLTVNKRTHQRFFINSGKEVINAQPGTAILTKVVNSSSSVTSKVEQEVEESKEESKETQSLFDFFLIPHICSIGVAKATHFHVVHNNTGLNKKAIVEFSHAFCYYYFNWSGAVRIPSACMYAHKLSLFASTVKKRADARLQNNLYFL